MGLDELYELIEKYNTIKLKNIEEFKIGQVNSLYLYNYFIDKRESEYSWYRIVRSFLLRCFSKLYKFEKYGNGSPIVFVARNNSGSRKDHLNNTRNVCTLLNNKTIVYGKRFIRLTIVNICTLFYPLSWNRTLKKIEKNTRFRWGLIANTYFDYLDFLEYLRFERKNHMDPSGLVLLSETHPVSQFMGQYFKNRKRTTVALMHSLMSKGDKEKMEVYNSMCDYLISYSPFATDKADAKAYDRYIKGIYELGMIQFVRSNLKLREISKINTIGIYLDGMGEKSIQSNTNMIQTTLDAFQNTEKRIYVKCHPSNTLEQIEYFKKNIRTEHDIPFYRTEVLSTDLEKTTDLMILRNTNCLLEGIYQQIPTFIFNMEPVDFKGLPVDIYFSSAEELQKLVEKTENNEMREPLKRLKEYMCGVDNPDHNYKKFFNDLGWN